MADPSQSVPPALLDHIHLISSSRYPSHSQSLPLDTIVDYLVKAPHIIRNAAAVSWQYIRPPPSGHIFLAWQPPGQPQFATDGYFWPGPETVHPAETKGYKLEIILADSGYVPGLDNRGSRRRVRYKLLSGPHGEPVDPNLEIVHYTQSPLEKQVPVNNLPQNPQQTRYMQQRRYLEEAGTLERKEFMFSDRTNWPKITMPGQKTPGIGNPYGPRPPMHGMPGMGRPSGPGQPFFPPGGGVRPGMNQPQSKRPRQMGMPGMPRPGVPGAPMPPGVDAEIIDEESPSIGDFLDLLSPREISTTRYTQHHEWMEEVLASPYAISQIIPEDPGFKLSGELSDLTKDLFEPSNANEPKIIDPEQVEELERRVKEFKQKGHDDITAMKATNNRKIEEMKARHLFMNLERKLANVPINGSEEEGEAIQKIISEAEQATRGKLSTREEVVQVQKGGLLDQQEAAAMQLENQAKDDGDQQQDEFGEFTNLDSAGEALDFYSGSYDDNGMTFENT